MPELFIAPELWNGLSALHPVVPLAMEIVLPSGFGFGEIWSGYCIGLAPAQRSPPPPDLI